MTQSPRNRKCKPALLRGLCGMPSALSLNEGLGVAARMLARRDCNGACAVAVFEPCEAGLLRPGAQTLNFLSELMHLRLDASKCTG